MVQHKRVKFRQLQQKLKPHPLHVRPHPPYQGACPGVRRGMSLIPCCRTRPSGLAQCSWPTHQTRLTSRPTGGNPGDCHTPPQRNAVCLLAGSGTGVLVPKYGTGTTDIIQTFSLSHTPRPEGNGPKLSFELTKINREKKNFSSISRINKKY